MDTISQVIWLLDGQDSKFKNTPHFPSLPMVFFPKTFRAIRHEGQIKKKIPNLDSSSLTDAASSLETLLGR